MRALLIVDRDFAHRELSHVKTILIGLVDTGVMPTVALPEDMRGELEQVPGATLIGYRDRGAVWTRGLRAREIADRLVLDEKKPFVVHAIGAKSHAIAAEVGHQISSTLVLDVHRRDSIPHAVGIIKERSGECMAIAPSAALARALVAEGATPASVREVTWGVMSRDADSNKPQVTTAGLVIAGSGQDRSAWESLVRALAQVASRREDFVILADSDATERSAISKLVSSLGLSPLYSRVPKLEANRDIILRADMLLLPDAEGVCRSIVLDAMAAGMTIVAAEDRDIPALSDHTIARLCSPEATEWASAIESLLEQPEMRKQLGDAARNYVSEHHRPSKYIASLVDAYEWLVGNDAIPIQSKKS